VRPEACRPLPAGVVFAYARDDMIAGSEWLKRMSPRTQRADPVAGAFRGESPAAIRGCRVVAAERGVPRSSIFAAIGIYVAFLMIVPGAR